MFSKSVTKYTTQISFVVCSTRINKAETMLWWELLQRKVFEINDGVCYCVV
jgi:hypothetical protein